MQCEQILIIKTESEDKIMLNLANSNVSANNESERKKQLKDSLLRGESVEVTQQGDIKPASEIRPEDGITTSLKPGDKFAADAASRQRKKLRDSLLRGESVEVTQYGDIKPTSEIRPEDGVTTSLKPGDKFASSL